MDASHTIVELEFGKEKAFNCRELEESDCKLKRSDSSVLAFPIARKSMLLTRSVCNALNSM